MYALFCLCAVWIQTSNIEPGSHHVRDRHSLSRGVLHFMVQIVQTSSPMHETKHVNGKFDPADVQHILHGTVQTNCSGSHQLIALQDHLPCSLPPYTTSWARPKISLSLSLSSATKRGIDGSGEV